MAGPKFTVEPEFGYPNLHDQTAAAIAGMWLFLVTDGMMFGALMLAWIYSRYWNMPGFDAGSHLTTAWLGSVISGVLITSSLAYSAGLVCIRAGRPYLMMIGLACAAFLGCCYLGLAGYDWHLGFAAHLWVNDPAFPVRGELLGGAKLFFVFYWMFTVVHAAHAAVGIGLIIYLLIRARRLEFSAIYYAPVEVVGLYWNFVTLLWMVLWPAIYLVGRLP